MGFRCFQGLRPPTPPTARTAGFLDSKASTAPLTAALRQRVEAELPLRIDNVLGDIARHDHEIEFPFSQRRGIALDPRGVFRPRGAAGRRRAWKTMD